MTTNFPGSLDSFTNPSSTDAMDSATVPHADQHADLNDAVESLQAKVGVDGSAVTSSLDYQVANQGLTFVKSQTIGSGVSSVAVSSAFSSTFQNYRILVSIESSSTEAGYQITLGSTTSGYYGGHYGYRWTGAAYSDIENNGSYCPIGAVGNGYGGWSVIDITDPYETNETAWSGNFSYRRISSGFGAFGFHGGMVNNSTSYTSFNIVAGGGTFTGGTIRVYGYNNG